MKITCIFNLYYHGTKNLNSSYYFFVEPLIEMGHDVQIIDFGTLRKIGGNLLVARVLMQNIKQVRSDVFFIIPCGNEIPKWLLGLITKYTNTITIAWNSDDDRRWNHYSKLYADVYDVMVTTYPHIYKLAREQGRKNIHLSQWACNPNYNHPLDLPKKYDVAFIGVAYEDRPDYIRRLQKEGFKVAFGGLNWDKYFDGVQTEFSQSEMSIIYNQSKLLLVFSKGYKDRKPQLKGRVFESPAYGVCTLIEQAPNLENFYSIGEEVVVFRNEDELVEKIKYYLTHEHERKKIAQAGYQRTVGEHAYIKRLEKLFEEIDLKKKKFWILKFWGRVVYIFLISYHISWLFTKRFIVCYLRKVGLKRQI